MARNLSTRTEKRLKILEEEEIAAVYDLPVFDDEERDVYFALTPPEKEALSQLHGVKSSIYYILQLGYFKARRQFFTFNLAQAAADARHVQRRYFPNETLTDLEIAKGTRLKQQSLILDLLQYRVCGAAERQQLSEKAEQLARISGRPIFVFRELIGWLMRQRLVAPGYSVMQEMIGAALQREKERLVKIVQANLSSEATAALNELLTNPRGLHEITKIKREPKDFSGREIDREIQQGEQIKALYAVAQTILPRLEISNESVAYYASLIDYYSVFQMSQLEENLSRLYLLCFIQRRYERLHDNLINCFIYRVRQLMDRAKEAAKEHVYTWRLEHHQNLHKAGQILKLFAANEIGAETPFAAVQTQAFAILPQAKLVQVIDHMMQVARLDEQLFQWEYLDQAASRMKRRLRPILRAIDFSATAANQPLLTAVNFLKEALQQPKPLTHYKPDKLPQRFIAENHKPYLYAADDKGEKRLRVDRYEFLIYRLLRNNLEAGNIFCDQSARFRSFEGDLLSDEQWADKERLIAEIGLPILNQTAEEHLAELKEALETRLTRANKRITSGENDAVVVKKSGRWHLPYTRGDGGGDPFFDALSSLDMQTVFQFVNRQSHFMNEFTHVLHRYAGRRADDRTLIAVILAWGTNMGLGRMAETSDISYHALAATSDNFLRLETLQKANDVVVNGIAQLPIFQSYQLGDAVHSSSDGQKFETLRHTINARYSSKYFGLMKGIVACTLVASHIPLGTRVIGANEHESHYVFDLLYNNLTDVRPTAHSTDTHGTNEVNFGILHFFGYQFAPRYRDLYDKVRKGLYGFQHPRKYDANWLLRPIRRINEELIIKEWDNIRRIIASLALKSTSQAVIIGKLSAYARKNSTKRALWEYDNIIRSLYLLDYIDSAPLRRHVQKALNRGESYHKLHRAVSFANFGKLRFKSEDEQQIWNECGRLIANCIIFYNATILSNVLRYHEGRGDEAAAAALGQVSPAAWQHVNFYGRYEFLKEVEPIDIDAVVEGLVSAVGWRRLDEEGLVD